MGFFKIGSHELFAWGWLPTAILLISAFQVAKITGMSHRCLAGLYWRNGLELKIFLLLPPEGWDYRHASP
jgi:hypothetical protein